MSQIVVIGALDTKGPEVEFVVRQIEARGHQVAVMDIGVLGAPAFPAAIAREEVASAAGSTLATLVAANDRGHAISVMRDGAVAVMTRLHRERLVDGVIGLGGGAGTTVATAAMRALPLGIPKVMVSTLASGDVRGFVGVKDIVMVPAIVDISGLNRISRGVFARAAGALCGMVDAAVDVSTGAPLVVASMFGNTTQCVEQAKARLEGKGFEVLVFHATGTGGQTMESLIESGQIAGVLDVTTTEWADELAGGVLSAGATRLEAAAKIGTPAVVAPGCLDMVNFWAPETVPEKYRGRRFYQHTPQITLMRTTPEENTELGRIVAEKLNASTGPVEVFLPLRGISVISAPGGAFYWPEADAALFASLRRHLKPSIPVHELDHAINDAPFASAMADALMRLMAAR